MTSSFTNSVNIYKILLLISLVCICLYCLVVYVVEKGYARIIRDADTLKHLKEVEEDTMYFYHFKGDLRKNISG